MGELDMTSLPSRNFQPQVYGVGAWTDHLHFAYDLVTLLSPSLIVELGMDRGESYFSFCQAVTEKNLTIKCYAVDTWTGDSHAGSYDEVTYLQAKKHNNRHYQGFSTLLRTTFDTANAQFHDGAIDLLHLDGLHSEEAAQHDLDRWLPKVRPSGLVLMHDVMVRERGFGVWKVWERLQAGGRSWAMAAGPGLGIWQKPPNESLPDSVESLLTGITTTNSEVAPYYNVRTAELREKIAREWRSGEVRQRDFLEQTVIQVFYTSDGVHREADSINTRIGHNECREIAMTLPPEAAGAPLRIDLVSPWTTVEMASLKVTSGDDVQFEANKAAEFDRLSLRGDLKQLSHSDHLCFQVTGIDPQLYLPVISGNRLTVTMRLRVTSSVAR